VDIASITTIAEEERGSPAVNDLLASRYKGLVDLRLIIAYHQ
jgi:hypothetical protein